MGKRPAGIELFVGNMGCIQREDTAFYAKRRSASHGNRTRTNSSKKLFFGATKAGASLREAESHRYAVNQFLKSVVREIRTLRSVGAGGGQPPLATQSGGEKPPATRLAIYLFY
jgi:hypothetical protein